MGLFLRVRAIAVIDNASPPGLFPGRNTYRFDDQAAPGVSEEEFRKKSCAENCEVRAIRARLFRYRLSPLAQLGRLLLCFCRAWQLIDATFQVGAFARNRHDRRGKSGGPPLLKLSLKVKRYRAHSQSSALVIVPVS